MGHYALGISSLDEPMEGVRLCRKYSSKSIAEIRQLIGTGQVIVEWNSSVSKTVHHDKGSLIAAIQDAVLRFESLGTSLSYFYRPATDWEWISVDSSQFRNLLHTDLECWNELLSRPG